MYVEEITISEWSQLNIEEFLCSTSLFRGQRDAQWDIVSSFGLSVSVSDYYDMRQNREFWMFLNFQRGAAEYLKGKSPDYDDVTGWLSLMQHHGTVTRLVDFTYSFYVACFFAFAGVEEKAAVWSIDAVDLHEAIGKRYDIDYSGARDEWDANSTKYCNSWLREYFKSAAVAEGYCTSPGVLIVDPFYQLERVRRQQGIFLMQQDINQSFMSNLDSMELRAASVKKYIFEKRAIDTGISYLSKMNITRETLFPGFDGFSGSINQVVLNRIS